MLIVGIYMGISLVKFVIHILSGFMTNILINQQLFTQKTIPKRPLYQMFFMADPSVPSGLRLLCANSIIFIDFTVSLHYLYSNAHSNSNQFQFNMLYFHQ